MSNKKVLISGYIGFSNFGDDALLYVLTNYLKSKNCDITALSANVQNTKEKFQINALYYKSFFSIFRGILNSDIVISGGGNLIQNETSTLSLFYYLFIIFVSKIFCKKVILFSQGIGPVEGFLPTFITKLILKMPDIITVRDIYSQRILSKWKIQSKFSHDAVWSLDTPQYTPENTVGIQLRSYEYLHKNFYKNLAKYVDMYFSNYKIQIFCLQNAADSKVAYTFQKELIKRNSSINSKIVFYEDINQLVSDFSKLKYLIAMRLHANILGLKFGIPILPISYSVKVKNLAYEFDIPFAEAVEDIEFNPLFRDLSLVSQNNPKVENARKRKFEWGYLDSIIDK